MNYKQQLKHKHRHMSLSNLITYIIIKDTSLKECDAAKVKTLLAKTNMVEDKPIPKMHEKNPIVITRRNILKIIILVDLTPLSRKLKFLCV